MIMGDKCLRRSATDLEDLVPGCVESFVNCKRKWVSNEEAGRKGGKFDGGFARGTFQNGQWLLKRICQRSFKGG